MTPGKFITFEGGEGSGKSTQARLLAERLRGLGHDVVVTREPGGTPFAEQVRQLLLAPDTAPHGPVSEALMFYAARADHLEKVIRPALAAGRWVICDRFSDSTDVYQSHAGGLDRAMFDMLEHAIVAATRPSLTLVIDIDARLGQERATARRGSASRGSDSAAADAYERRDIVYHETLRRGFLAIAEAEPQRCLVIDGAKPIDNVAAAVWAGVSERFGADTGAAAPRTD
ncbi:MAG: dTMP kinase [Hyphomicrobiaceae bacterium]|nr:dTMP kinase [Hyphomicrobiaceae bacterium]